MPIGITPGRGPWEYIRSPLTTLSQGMFQKGEPVVVSIGRTVSLYTNSSNYSEVLGISTHASLNSLPAGYATIAVPREGCTAWVDTLTGEARSNLSFGQVGSIVSAGGITSTFSVRAGAGNLPFVEVRTAEYPANSSDSRIEVAFIQQALVLYSVSSNTYP